jgi:O-antigen/teichoic acid export membrane protein
VQLIKLIFLNSTAQLIGKFASAVVTLFISGIVARSLGQEGYGQFAIMTTYAAAFYAAADFGFNGVALRLAQGDPGQVKSHFQKLIGLRIIYGIALIALAIAILNFFPYSPTLKIVTIITCLTILTQAVYNSANLIFQSRLRYDLATISLIAGSLLSLGIVYLLSSGNINLVLIGAAYVAGGLATVFTSLTLIRVLIGPFSPIFDWKEWRLLMTATLPVGLTIIFNLVYFRADTFILSILKPTTEVGIYGAAYKLFEVALTPPTFFINALYPILIKKFAEDPNHFKLLVRYSIFGLTAASAMLSLIGVILAPFLINLIYGSKFDNSVLPFRLLLIGLPVFYLSNLYMWILILLKRQTPMFFIYTLGMLLNIALNLYFIPHFSYLASAIITGVSEGVILILTFMRARNGHLIDNILKSGTL